jgi:5-methylcytosine-specific restriction protein A
MSLFAICLDDPEIAEEANEGEVEGRALLQLSRRFERRVANRIACIQHHGFECAVCGFTFSAEYGALGDGFIEVHHLLAVSAMNGGFCPDPRKDMIPLCSNCHKMVHRRTPPIPPQELLLMRQQQRELSVETLPQRSPITR